MTPSKPKSIPISPEKIPLNPPFIKEETPPPLKKEGRLPVVSSGATKPNGFSAVREAGGEFSASPPATIRPVVEDIKFTPKLYGPLEEIGQMTLDDFRKLSGDPNEVMLKIKDKLGLLRGESFKKYQAGIEAWHKSLVYAEYLKILEQSLKTGLPLAESIVKNKTLTQLEFDAIINSRVEE